MANIGVDAGGTLCKLVIEDNGKLHYKRFPTEHINMIKSLVSFDSFSTIHITGGASHKLVDIFPRAVQVSEFKSIALGTNILLQKEKWSASSFMLVSVGTGTSIHFVSEEKVERVTGTGIGGGTLVGLGTLLGAKDFEEIMKWSRLGDRTKVDLTVKDIYGNGEAPLNALLTASNFAKTVHQSTSRNDHMVGIINMVAEVILVLALEAAKAYEVNDFVFIGSTFYQNDVLKERIAMLQTEFKFHSIILEQGMYAGALGALCWNQNKI
ncbi:hypothetical protein Q73_06550 [Bacillus coahuilensis m2-6]|uniref:type II pantothenate kinase n=1 Tax=Bacillus coahuilensis TaxID=408580 RepID=UPI0001850EE7|nr:type II pantothenate kinase [Bacillus coahuilensis]KUP08392.1 hypothetical protein Q73_06550 [Bacillus coahuilensis m2-6]